VTPNAEARIRAALDDLGAAIIEALAEPPDADAPEKLYSIPEAAGLLGVSRNTTYRLLGAGGLRSVKVGGRRLVPSSAIRAYIETAVGGPRTPPTG
jgi:excisionase family DNA binding protein